MAAILLVTLPLLRPFLALAVFLSFTTAFADLANVWMLTGGRIIFPVIGTYAYWLGHPMASWRWPPRTRSRSCRCSSWRSCCSSVGSTRRARASREPSTRSLAPRRDPRCWSRSTACFPSTSSPSSHSRPPRRMCSAARCTFSTPPSKTTRSYSLAEKRACEATSSSRACPFLLWVLNSTVVLGGATSRDARRRGAGRLCPGSAPAARLALVATRPLRHLRRPPHDPVRAASIR